MADSYVPQLKASLFCAGMTHLVVLEIAPLLTALLLAGRVGGSYAGKADSVLLLLLLPLLLQLLLLLPEPHTYSRTVSVVHCCQINVKLPPGVVALVFQARSERCKQQTKTACFKRWAYPQSVGHCCRRSSLLSSLDRSSRLSLLLSRLRWAHWHSGTCWSDLVLVLRMAGCCRFACVCGDCAVFNVVAGSTS